MSKETNGVKWAKSPNHRARRESALKRLQDQLKVGTKISRNPKTKKPIVVELSEKDKNRIEKEIATLKTRI